MENKKKLNIMQLFKTAVFIYRKSFLYWFIIWIAVYLPLDIIDHFFSNSLFSVLNNNSVSIDIGAMLHRNFFILPLFLLPRALFNSLALAAISFVVKQRLSQKKIFIYDMFSNSVLKWKKLFFACVICYLIIFATSFLIVPPIYFSVAFYFASTVIALSQCGELPALLISKMALSGYWFETFFWLLLKNILVILLELISQAVLFVDARYFILSSLLFYIVNIFFEVFVIVWFLDISTVKIGFYLAKYFSNGKKNG